MPSGFLKAYATESDEPGFSSGTAYVLEYPNTVLLVKPMDDKIIVCTSKAAAGPGAGEYSWIKIPDDNWDAVSETSYGISTAEVSGGVYTFEVSTFDLSGSALGSQSTEPFTFSDGKLISQYGTMEIYMTASGMFIGDEGSGEGGFAGTVKNTVNISDAASKNYKGVMFKYWHDTTPPSGETTAIGTIAHPGISNAIRGYSYTDGASIESDAYVLSDGPTLELISQDTFTGITTGEMTHNTGYKQGFKMVINPVGGKYIIFGISKDDDGHPYNFLVVEQ